MKIGIIEICEGNHYTAVEALALTYAFSQSNQITVFITEEMAKLYHFKDEFLDGFKSLKPNNFLLLENPLLNQVSKL